MTMNDTPNEAPALLRATATLPSGREVVMRQATGKDELSAAGEAGDMESARGRMSYSWSLIERTIVSLGGETVDPTTASGIRDLFDPADWRCLGILFDQLNAMPKGAEDSFRSSIKIGT